MRVALVSSGLITLPPRRGGAVEEYVYQLAKNLRKLGVDAIAIDRLSNGEEHFIEEVDGALIARIPSKKPLINFKRITLEESLFGFSVVKYVDVESFDVVHANTAFTGFTTALHGRKYRLVYTCHNPLWPEESVHASEHIVRLVEGYAMRRSDIVVALNNTMKRAILSKARVSISKLVVVPNGVDIEFFKPGIRGDEVLEKLGVEVGNYILFVGRISPVKGVHLLIKAFEHSAKTLGHSMKLLVVGPLSGSFTGKEPTRYARFLMEYASRKLPQRVIFTGPVDRKTLRVLYSNTYCLVLPSYAEAFSMVLLEAMSSGIPVIGSKVGGIPDVVADDVNGLLFDKGCWLELSEKLTTLINDRSLRNKLAENARKIAEEVYSWRTVALRLKSLYKALM